MGVIPDPIVDVIDIPSVVQANLTETIHSREMKIQHGINDDKHDEWMMLYICRFGHGWNDGFYQCGNDCIDTGAILMFQTRITSMY